MPNAASSPSQFSVISTPPPRQRPACTDRAAQLTSGPFRNTWIVLHCVMSCSSHLRQLRMRNNLSPCCEQAGVRTGVDTSLPRYSFEFHALIAIQQGCSLFSQLKAKLCIHYACASDNGVVKVLPSYQVERRDVCRAAGCFSCISSVLYRGQVGTKRTEVGYSPCPLTSRYAWILSHKKSQLPAVEYCRRFLMICSTCYDHDTKASYNMHYMY